MSEDILKIIEALNELREDSTIPKNVKCKIECMITLLSEDADHSMKINRALHEIEQMTEDCNMQSYTRTQIFNVVNLLEMVK